MAYRTYVSYRSYLGTGMRTLILILVAQACLPALSQAQSPKINGIWKVEITFGNGDNRSLRFEAQDNGKGSLLLVDARLNAWEGAKPSEAKWTQDSGNAISFSGAVEFPLGNVGRDPGKLVCKGKFETEN